MKVRTLQGLGEPPRGPVPVRTRRLELGLTMKRLAERCRAAGITVSTSELSRIERRIHTPRPALRLVLAGVLGMSVTDFEEGDSNA